MLSDKQYKRTLIAEPTKSSIGNSIGFSVGHWRFVCSLHLPRIAVLLAVLLAATTVVSQENAADPFSYPAASNSAAQSSSIGQDGPTGTVAGRDLSATLAKKGSVVFRDTPLAEVILILSSQWDVNLVAGSEIDGNVSGTFKNESLQEILDSLLTANGYNYRQIGNSLVVVASGDQQSGKPTFEVAVIDAPVGNSEDLTELIDALRLQMSPEGKIQPIRATRKLAIHDSPERIAAVRQLLEQILGRPVAASANDVSGQNVGPGVGESSRSENLTSTTPQAVTQSNNSSTGALELRPQYVTAKDLQESIALGIGAVSDTGEGAAPGATGASVAVIEQENMLVVFGSEAVRRRALALMQQLDRPRPQVRITGYIYDVDLGEIERLGVDWNHRMMTQSVDANGVPRNLVVTQGGLLTPNAPNNAAQIVTGMAEDVAEAATGAAATAADPTGGQFLLRTLNSRHELQALVQALDQTDGSRLLADPHVTVVDRRKASLGIVTQIPVQQLTQTTQGGNIGTTSFQEAGITLEVTPRISADGTIEMEVSPEFSVLSGFQAGNPIIDTRRATTVVRVSHGQALVIGGLRSKTTVETIKGIPCLKDLKLIGGLFRTHSTDIRESEMVVLIMPEIVGYCGGLEREMHALDVMRHQLSHVPTAIDGPFTPDCNDKWCPHHNPRERIHNGMHDIGLVGGYDPGFMVQPSAIEAIPSPTLAPDPASSNYTKFDSLRQTDTPGAAPVQKQQPVAPKPESQPVRANPFSDQGIPTVPQGTEFSSDALAAPWSQAIQSGAIPEEAVRAAEPILQQWMDTQGAAGDSAGDLQEQLQRVLTIDPNQSGQFQTDVMPPMTQHSLGTVRPTIDAAQPGGAVVRPAASINPVRYRKL